MIFNLTLRFILRRDWLLFFYLEEFLKATFRSLVTPLLDPSSVEVPLVFLKIKRTPKTLFKLS